MPLDQSQQSIDDAMSLKVVGWTEVKIGSEELFQAIERRAGSQLKTVARQRRDLTRLAVPKDTGHFRDSLRSGGLTKSETGTITGAYAGFDRATVPYGGWIEFGGTRGRPYVPEGRYLFPIAEAAGHTIQKDMSSAAKAEIKRQTWPRPVME